MQKPYFLFVFLVILVHQDEKPLFLSIFFVILVFRVVGGWSGVLE
jgi:hypothetical protein